MTGARTCRSVKRAGSHPAWWKPADLGSNPSVPTTLSARAAGSPARDSFRHGCAESSHPPEVGEKDGIAAEIKDGPRTSRYALASGRPRLSMQLEIPVAEHESHWRVPGQVPLERPELHAFETEALQPVLQGERVVSIVSVPDAEVLELEGLCQRFPCDEPPEVLAKGAGSRRPVRYRTRPSRLA